MQDLDRVRYVSANYDRLQGLRTVFVGLVIFLWMAGNSVVPGWLSGKDQDTADTLVGLLIIFGILGLFGTALIYYQISGYYERRYGSVSYWSSVLTPARHKVLGVAIVVAVFLGGPVTALLLGVAMLIAYWPERRFRMHHVLMAVLVIVVSLVFMVAWPLGFASKDALDYLAPTALGLFFFVGGIFDHLLLVRTMKPVPEGGSNAAD